MENESKVFSGRITINLPPGDPEDVGGTIEIIHAHSEYWVEMESLHELLHEQMGWGHPEPGEAPYGYAEHVTKWGAPELRADAAQRILVGSPAREVHCLRLSALSAWVDVLARVQGEESSEHYARLHWLAINMLPQIMTALFLAGPLPQAFRPVE